MADESGEGGITSEKTPKAWATLRLPLPEQLFDGTKLLGLFVLICRWFQKVPHRISLHVLYGVL